MNKTIFLKVKNPTLREYDEICVEDVKNIIPVCDKAGNPHLLINFYDHEYCMNTSTFCDEIEQIIIEKTDSF